MTFKTPDFWYRDKNTKAPLAETLLTPLSWLYNLGTEIHKGTKSPQKLPVPILCVGNINAGGSGKTPTAIALLKLIRSYNLAKKPFFLTRGYGGTLKKTIIVDPEIHTYKDVGDEALLLTRHGPTIVSSNRLKGAELAKKSGADLIIMDDGLQNYDLMPDIKVIVVDGLMKFGNEKTIPAGPLREPLQTGLAKADFFVLINQNANIPSPQPVFKATPETPIKLCDKRPWLAFSGLGYPQKFFSYLKNDLHLNITETRGFPDHHPFTPNDLETLNRRAEQIGAKLITTEKDAVRLPANNNIQILPIHLTWENEDALVKLLRLKLPS